MMQADLILKGGTVVDGNGGAPFVGDVAIKDGNIIAVGANLTIEGARIVNVAGKHVMPGWVDIHTHLDMQCMWDPLLSPSGPSGVTTVVMGSCGVGAAPTRKVGREFMIKTLSAVEDIPAEVIRKGAKWTVGGKDWETFAEYLQCLDTVEKVCDVGTIVPHSCVRNYVLGPDRANLSDRPGGPWTHPLSQADKEAIAACVKESVAAGALGFSTTRWWEHRDNEGILCAGSLADADELILCARAVAEAGSHLFQMHGDFKSYDDVPEDRMDDNLRKEHFEREWSWMRFISKEYGLTVTWLGTGGEDHLRDHVAQGYKFVCQTLVRPQSLIMNWKSRTHPFEASATFRKIKKDLPSSEWCAELLKLDTRKRIIQEMEDLCKKNSKMGRLFNQFWGPDSFRWANFYPMLPGWDYEPAPDQSIKELAASSGKSAFEVSYDTMMQHGGNGVIWQAQSENVTGFYNFLHWRLQQSYYIPGISDAGAHLAIFQDGTSPTSMISFWARDRTRGPKLPLELCVQKQARDTAYLYGLTDRGTLEPGKKADLNVVDMNFLQIHQPEPTNDLPLGAVRWNQCVTGYDMTIVSGVVTFENGKHTGAFPGRIVRKPFTGSEPTNLPGVPPQFKGYRGGGASAEGTTAEAILQNALNAEGGASRMSTISLAMEKETQQQEQHQQEQQPQQRQQSKL